MQTQKKTLSGSCHVLLFTLPLVRVRGEVRNIMDYFTVDTTFVNMRVCLCFKLTINVNNPGPFFVNQGPDCLYLIASTFCI